MSDFRFIKRFTEQDVYMVDVDGFDSEVPIKEGRDYEVECNFGHIEWEIQFELREYGIKYMDVKLIYFEVELTWLDELGDDIDTITYRLEDFEEHEVEFDFNFSNRGNRHVEPTNLLIDFDNKKVTLDIY